MLGPRWVGQGSRPCCWGQRRVFLTISILRPPPPLVSCLTQKSATLVTPTPPIHAASLKIFHHSLSAGAPPCFLKNPVEKEPPLHWESGIPSPDRQVGHRVCVCDNDGCTGARDHWLCSARPPTPSTGSRGAGGGPGARRSAPKSLPPGSGSSPGQFTCLLYTRGARGSERVVLQQESSHAGKWGEELAGRLEGGGGGGEEGGEAAEADAGEECGRQGVTRCPFGKQLGII